MVLTIWSVMMEDRETVNGRPDMSHYTPHYCRTAQHSALLGGRGSHIAQCSTWGEGESVTLLYTSD